MNIEASEKQEDLIVKQDKKELLEILDEMIKSYERLPQHAMLQPITHADLCSVMMLLSSILRLD